MKWHLISAAFLLSLLYSPLGAVSPLLKVDPKHPIAISVYPARSIAPSTLRVTVRILASALNREMAIIVDGDEFFRESDWELTAMAPTLYVQDYPDVPEGEYHITAVLRKGTQFEAHETIEVCGDTCPDSADLSQY